MNEWFNSNPYGYAQSYSQTPTFAPYRPNMQQAIPNTNIEYVSGIEGIRALPLPPNTTKLVLDSDGKTFYVKRTDAEGRPHIAVYSYTEYVEDKKDGKPMAQFVKIEDFEAFKQEVFEKISKESKRKEILLK